MLQKGWTGSLNGFLMLAGGGQFQNMRIYIPTSSTEQLACFVLSKIIRILT